MSVNMHLRIGSGLRDSGTNLKLQQASPQVQYQQPGTNGFLTLSGGSVTGNPDSPAAGDTLTLPTNIGTATCSGGTATYTATGHLNDGAGYYKGTGSGIDADAADWAATSN